jgi:hypothetical protein
MKQDQQSEESAVNPTEADQITDDIALEEGLEPNKEEEATTDESSIDKEEEETTHEEKIIFKAPAEEAEEAQNSEESNEKQIDEEVKLHSHLK